MNCVWNLLWSVLKRNVLGMSLIPHTAANAALKQMFLIVNISASMIPHTAANAARSASVYGVLFIVYRGGQ